METFALRNLSFSYPGQEEKAVNGVSLTVKRGEFLVLCGPSGCGKSTLLRQLKTVLTPYGERSGEIFFEGKPLCEVDERTQSQRIGFVQQSPDNQIVTDKVWHELAFGLESLGCDTPAIRRRVAEMASFFGIESWFYKNVSELSGGQKQLLNLASVIVMQPSVLILDEPTAQLDPIAASDFLATLGKINRELGTTVILTEQRLDEVLPYATCAAVMEHGRILSTGTPSEVGAALKEENHPMFLAMPAPMRVWAAVETDLPCPVSVREGRDWLSAFAQTHELAPLVEKEKAPAQQERVISAKELWFRYERNADDVVKGLTLTVQKGEFLALLGGNGAGKSTSLKLLAGILKPYRGEVIVQGRIGVLPQDPQSLFLKKTVGEDLREVAGEEDELSRITRLCRLDALLQRHPYDLSGGEQQRLALAKVLLRKPDILLLDEPTKGLDAEFKRELGTILHSLRSRGVTILMVSHDAEFCAAYADCCAMLFDGNVVNAAPPRTFFSGNRFYTTAANRMARELLPEAVTAEEVIACCGGNLLETKLREELPKKNEENGQKELQEVQREPKRLSRRSFFAALGVLFLIPLTLYAGETYFEGRQYGAVSLLILLETMLPFFLIFEGRKPRARELVVIAVLCGAGVAGRLFFYMLPQFKPVMALAIIAGVALGCESGFMVGAMTMLASNVLLSQGPWTPWQMFAMGIIGFLAGLLFQKGRLPRSRETLCVYGAVSCIVMYGGIMNCASAILSSSILNWKIIAAYLLSGFPMDCVHAVATVLFLWFAAEPMLEKLERLKVKYGLI